MSAKFRCPRGYLGHDATAKWEKPSGGAMGKYRSCSYCGSAHPDDFMAACREGVLLGPTDKAYKVYLNHSDGKFYFQHLSEEQRQEFFELLTGGKLHIGSPGYFYVLPFFIIETTSADS